jgi:hypothetical protein
MILSEEDAFIIRTIAHYTFLDKCEQGGIINKEQYNEMYENFTPIQTIIIAEYLVFETEIADTMSSNILDKNSP